MLPKGLEVGLEIGEIMADETKTEAVRLAVLEVKVDNIEKRVDGMEAVIQDIREVLVELRNKNPINEFLQKYWKHMIAIVVLVMSGNSAVLVEVLKRTAESGTLF